jgi:hypothetical protein
MPKSEAMLHVFLDFFVFVTAVNIQAVGQLLACL